MPYTQLDAETDLELPEEENAVGPGGWNSDNTSIRFNYLRARCELAVIQGKVNDVLYSRRAHKLSHEQRLQHVLHIDRMLSDWRTAIAPELLQDADTLHRQFPTLPTDLMTNMYNRHMESLFRIHSIYSFDQDWIDRVRCYLSPVTIELGDDEIDGEIKRTDLAPLPTGWGVFVKYCRSCLQSLVSGHETEYSIW